MMDNQHRLIKGYRDLTVEEIALINDAKELGAKVEKFIDEVNAAHDRDDIGLDPRWLNIAKTDLQKGFMSLIRAIARPDSF